MHIIQTADQLALSSIRASLRASSHATMSNQRSISSYFGPSSSSSGPSQSQPWSQSQPSRPQPHQHHQRGNHSDRRTKLKAVAAETRTLLPAILSRLPHLTASRSDFAHLETLPPLRTADCPAHPKTAVRVVNSDSFTAAITLAERYAAPGKAPGAEKADRPAVLNLASPTNPGGGWTSGALAQEEALCYRSSLALSLHRRFYPFRQLSGVYSPDVVIIREEMAAGHALYTCAEEDMPVVSVVSVAALRRPPVKKVAMATAGGGPPVMREIFAKDGDRELTKGKMRMSLRLAAARGHDILVLGALGCGAFGNPPGEIVACWAEVLGEAEFGGGWWRDVVFAVLDTKKEGNFTVFKDALDGIEV